MSLKEAQAFVGDFHEKYGFARNIRFSEIPVNQETATNDIRLQSIGKTLVNIAKDILSGAIAAQEAGDPRMYRGHLLVEEVGEYLIDAGKRDEKGAADALGDIEYVLLGAAETHDIPLHEVFLEIHASNMTKEARSEDNRRMSRKGVHYVPPDIGRAINEGRLRDYSERRDRAITEADYETAAEYRDKLERLLPANNSTHPAGECGERFKRDDGSGALDSVYLARCSLSKGHSGPHGIMESLKAERDEAKTPEEREEIKKRQFAQNYGGGSMTGRTQSQYPNCNHAFLSEAGPCTNKCGVTREYDGTLWYNGKCIQK